jgi:nucleosome binding factor SPN SPT16 subunit
LAQDFEHSIEKDTEVQDMSTLVQEVLCVKEENEIQNVRKSAKLTCYLQNKIIEHVENIIDEELKERHNSISQKIGNPYKYKYTSKK